MANNTTKEKLIKQFRSTLGLLAKQVLHLIGQISLAEYSGTPYYDDMMERLEDLLWQIKTRERKYKALK
jgi:hypothetical protein